MSHANLTWWILLDDDNENVNDLHIGVDVFHPRNWDSGKSKMIELLATKGPKRYFTIVL